MRMPASIINANEWKQKPGLHRVNPIGELFTNWWKFIFSCFFDFRHLSRADLIVLFLLVSKRVITISLLPSVWDVVRFQRMLRLIADPRRGNFTNIVTHTSCHSSCLRTLEDCFDCCGSDQVNEALDGSFPLIFGLELSLWESPNWTRADTRIFSASTAGFDTPVVVNLSWKLILLLSDEYRITFIAQCSAMLQVVWIVAILNAQRSERKKRRNLNELF